MLALKKEMLVDTQSSLTRNSQTVTPSTTAISADAWPLPLLATEDLIHYWRYECYVHVSVLSTVCSPFGRAIISRAF